MGLARREKTPDGVGFLVSGQPWTWRGTLTWPLYGKFLNEGENVVRSVLRNRRDVGANTVCCAGMLSWGSPFTPAHPQYWSGLRSFVELAEQELLRVCFVVFCDTRSIMPDLATQRAHWERFYVTLGDKTNATLVLTNQPGHPSQAIDVMAFAPPPSVAGFPPLLAARHNPLEDQRPITPAWAFSAFCGKRNDPNWFMEAGGLSMWTVVNDLQGTHGVTVFFEPPPCGRQAQWTDPGKWRQLARSLCFKGTAGGNFYSDQDARAEMYAGVTHACALEYLGNIPNQ